MAGEHDDLNDLDGDQPNGTTGPGLSSTILKGLRFQPPGEFDGTESKFEFFSMKLKSYLCLGDVKYENYLNRSEASRTPLQ